MAVEFGDSVLVTQLDKLANWCRKNSLWPMPFATACCGIELMATGASRHDIARFGAEAMRFSPRQCDLMIVAGRVVMKMVPVMQRIWLQMPEPKWCISMGACASSGGVFDTYAVVQGIDRFLPVDVYVPGCPPRPEQLIRAVLAYADGGNPVWKDVFGGILCAEIFVFLGTVVNAYVYAWRKGVFQWR